VRPERAAEHSPPSIAAVMEEQSYTSTHPLGHTGPVTGSLYLLQAVNQGNPHNFSRTRIKKKTMQNKRCSAITKNLRHW